MNIEFYDHGVTATVIINGMFWEFGRYCRVVDAALFCGSGKQIPEQMRHFYENGYHR